ncbi:hypothetical protein BH10PSE1_BH10PSE1_09120 [soil metagenome]
MAQRSVKADAGKSPRGARVGTQLSQERWRQILEVATRLFRDKGFAGTSMQDVSDEVGLLKGSLYYYFRSKEELLFEVLRDLHTGGTVIVESANFGTENPLAELQEFLRRLTIYAGEKRDQLAIFFRDFRFVPPEHSKEIIAERDMYVVVAQRLIDEAKALKMMDASINSRVAALSILGASSTTHEWYRPNGPISLEAIGEQIASMIVNGLVGARVETAKAAAAGDKASKAPPAAVTPLKSRPVRKPKG